MQKIGLFGGTFDPVHIGHLAVGKAVVNQLDLNQLIYIPAPLPPHKQEIDITPFHHRLAMLEIAIAGGDGFSVSPIEAEHQGPSYTIDTIAALRQRFKEEVFFYYVIGLDAFAEICTWKNYQQLLVEVTFVVVDRPSLYEKTCEHVIMSELEGYLQESDGCWEHENGSKIYRLDMEPVSVSSTIIRGKCHNGHSIEGMVPPAVLLYIQENGLYS